MDGHVDQNPPITVHTYLWSLARLELFLIKTAPQCRWSRVVLDASETLGDTSGIYHNHIVQPHTTGYPIRSVLLLLEAVRWVWH